MQTVLILEDNASVLALIRSVVKSRGYAVLEAISTQETFERFDENDAQVDLLIAEIRLTSGPGIPVALELRSLLPNLKMILISEYPESGWDKQDTSWLEELPSDSVITLQKPFVPASLSDSLDRLIGLPLMNPTLRMQAT
jgi:two-component system cell cycle sensor histidine kinase/response regulator CckA